MYIPGGAPKQWTTDAARPPTPGAPARDRLPAAGRPPDEVRRARVAVWAFLAAATARIRLSAQGR